MKLRNVCAFLLSPNFMFAPSLRPIFRKPKRGIEMRNAAKMITSGQNSPHEKAPANPGPRRNYRHCLRRRDDKLTHRTRHREKSSRVDRPGFYGTGNRLDDAAIRKS